MASIRVGISGWRYRNWRGDFYPQGLPQREELAYAASRLTTAELNGSFYSLQRPSSYARWRDETPVDFVFAVKGGRYITHMKRLVDVEAPLANFFASGVLALGPKLGPVLWQLPERQAFDAERLAAFFDLLPRTAQAAAALAQRHDDKVAGDRALTELLREDLRDQRIRHALEVRHQSFLDPAAATLLRDNDIGLVVADTAGRWPLIEEVTSDLVYVRLHGDTELYASGYGDDALNRWAERCLHWAGDGLDVVVYFDNDARGHAPHDAEALLRRLPSPPAYPLASTRAGA
jgi:uncharacterized protein YecE (DUF72 family)